MKRTRSQQGKANKRAGSDAEQIVASRSIIPLGDDAGRVIAEVSIDEDDFDRLNAHRWCLGTSGYATRGTRIGGRFRCVFMHRDLVAVPPGMFIDHIDGDRLNNRKSNLRIATKSQNMCNRGVSRRSTTGYKGVFRARGKWRAQIVADHKTHHLGVFTTPKAAHGAYLAAAMRLHGEFAHG